MISKKLACTVAFMAILATGLLAPGYAAAEGDTTSLPRMPVYISELRTFLEVFFQEAAPEEAEEKIHVVARGETLRSIARLYDMDVPELAALNQIANPDLILVGQEIKVSYPAEIEHTLVRGETLAHLARIYGVDLEDILRPTRWIISMPCRWGWLSPFPIPRKSRLRLPW
jgi:hypothetical protein